jgi:hypothetical protein
MVLEEPSVQSRMPKQFQTANMPGVLMGLS